MRLSKSVLKSAVVPQKVLEYVPPKFELGTAQQAKAYLDGRRAKANDFRMSDVIRLQTGVHQVEATSVEEDVEHKVLERLKQVQESAYQEAYQLGLDEGKHAAFQKTSSEIKSRLDNLEILLQSIGTLKKDLVQHNESHLIQLAFQMAKRLAYAEVQTDPSIVTSVVRDAIEMAQIEEEVTVQVAPSQLDFLETVKAESGRDLEFLKNVKLQAVEGITPGGCVIETNYGEIDARFEERVDKLWAALGESLHRVKNRVVLK
jgi:flagellar assembly protein FliH